MRTGCIAFLGVFFSTQWVRNCREVNLRLKDLTYLSGDFGSKLGFSLYNCLYVLRLKTRKKKRKWFMVEIENPFRSGIVVSPGLRPGL